MPGRSPKKNATNGFNGSAFIRRRLWYRALWEEEQATAGADPYLWGFRSTRPEVDKLLEYCHRQGLTTRKFEPEEMFHPSTLET